eukprot:1508-Alexandrium_andersonii.AAC.1
MPPPPPAELPIVDTLPGESGPTLDAIVEEEADFGDGVASSQEKEAGGDVGMPQAGEVPPPADGPELSGAVGGEGVSAPATPIGKTTSGE